VIRFNNDTIQENMNHIKMYETHLEEAERKLDMIQNTLNRIKHIEKILPLKGRTNIHEIIVIRKIEK
jgi:predicted RNase H-like nuclease (RuvC/YqgF family)